MGKSIRAMQSAANLNEWALLVSECRQSGLSATEWCRRKGIKPNLYFKWQRKVFDALMGQQGTQLQELPSGEGGVPDKVHFAELPIPVEAQNAIPMQAGPAKGVVVATLRVDGAEIDIYSGADMNVVEALWRVMGRAQ